MTSIIIYTRKEVLDEKLKPDDANVLYWTLPHRPRRFDEHEYDNVFFAYDGAIRGVFESWHSWIGDGQEPIPDNAVVFHRLTWKELPEPIPTKAFQGFKYADKVPELTNIIEELYQ